VSKSVSGVCMRLEWGLYLGDDVSRGLGVRVKDLCAVSHEFKSQKIQ